LAFEALGLVHLRNIARPVEAFVVRLDAGPHADRPPAEPAQAYSNLPRLANALIGRELLTRLQLLCLADRVGDPKQHARSGEEGRTTSRTGDRYG
jgi:hypothetical protein